MARYNITLEDHDNRRYTFEIEIKRGRDPRVVDNVAVFHPLVCGTAGVIGKERVRVYRLDTPRRRTK